MTAKLPPTMTPIAAVDLHLELLRTLRTTVGALILRTIGEATPSGSIVPPDLFAEATDVAQTFLVTGEMLNIAGEASVDLDGMPLFPHDLADRNMFIVLDDVGWDYFSHALRDGEVDVLGMGTIRAISLIDVAAFPGGEANTISTIDPITGEQVDRGGAMVVLWGDAGVMRDAMDYDDEFVTDFGGLLPIDITGWSYATQWASLSPEDTEKYRSEIPFMPGAVASHVGEMRRRLLSILLLMGQEIYSQRERIDDRAARRRWQRSSLDHPEDFSIGVTRLRRYHHDPDSVQDPDSERMYTHRWYVRGHWRRLHRGTPEERAVWVRPYIKGPEHGQFIERFRVTSLDR